MIQSLRDFQHPYFIGVAGSGMSALAQYLQGDGKTVKGSDRLFQPGLYNEVKEKLEEAGIACFLQDGSGMDEHTDLVVVSTAIEETVIEVQLARKNNIPILRRSELLALIAASKKTIAVAGTSGKSTTSAMLFDILEQAGLNPGIISGAGLVSLIRQGKIGNAQVGKGDWLVIEADESDGSIVQYHPEIGLLLNVDMDHQEMDELMRLFTIFRNNSKHFVVNRTHPMSARLSVDAAADFALQEDSGAGYIATGFQQQGMRISFQIRDTTFELQIPGNHNMENALAAAAVAAQIGVPLQTAADALKNYEGIYRRHQVLGEHKGVWLIDDYAHNPVKCAAAIRACQPLADKVIAWFQPHGYKPTRFLRHEFVKELVHVLRPQDEIWMSEIYYAGGTAVKDISAEDLINDIKAEGKNAYFIYDRNDFLQTVTPHFSADTVLLLMGARDPSLESFAKSVWEQLKTV